jgi:hypothetical protein
MLGIYFLLTSMIYTFALLSAKLNSAKILDMKLIYYRRLLYLMNKLHKPEKPKSGICLVCKGKMQSNLELHVATRHGVNELITELMINMKRLQYQIDRLKKEAKKDRHPGM